MVMMDKGYTLMGDNDRALQARVVNHFLKTRGTVHYLY